MSRGPVSTDAPDPRTLADLALDGDGAYDDALAAGGAEHIRSVRRVERLLSIEKNAPKTPDLTATVLDDVGARRGWLDGRSRAMVWGGRGLVAATLLGALAITLGARRANPEITPVGPEVAALASVVEAGERAALGATAPIETVVETIEGGTPVLVRLTATIDGVMATESDFTLARVSCSPAPESGGRVVVVNYSLDPASQRTIDAVCRFESAPRWVRAVGAGHASRERD